MKDQRTKRLERKLPNLLSPSNTTSPQGWNEYMKNRYRIGQLKRKDPTTYNTIIAGMDSLVRQLDNESQAIVDHARKVFNDNRGQSPLLFFVFT